MAGGLEVKPKIRLKLEKISRGFVAIPIESQQQVEFFPFMDPASRLTIEQEMNR